MSNLKLGSGVAWIPAMKRAGVNIALGTDGVSSNNNHDIFEEMKFAAILHLSLIHISQPHENGGHLGAGGAALGVQGGVRHPGDKLLGIGPGQSLSLIHIYQHIGQRRSSLLA